MMKTRVRRHGRMNSLWMMLLGGAVSIGTLSGLLWWGGPGRHDEADRLSVYCAAGIRHAMEKIAWQYELECGVHIDLQFGGSHSLLNQIQVNKFDRSDLYLAADDYYTELAQTKGLAAESLPIAHMRPVIAVAKGNPKKIQSLDDLLRGDVRVVVANPDQAAVGRATRQRLAQVQRGATDLWQELEAQVTDRGVFKPTVMDVANDIKLGAMDAGIVWDATVAMPHYRQHLEAIAVPELDGDPNLVTVCVLQSSRQPTAALKFARYLSARDRGLPVFEEFGLRPVEGDVWAARPEVHFFCGAVNRRVVEPIVAEFAEREGVEINTIYDGCGILTSRMKTVQDQRTDQGFPDVYMACDVYYLENVKAWFQEAVNVSEIEIVIAVPKGSDKVTSLEDLVAPSIRVAVGQPDRCTIGALTRRLLVSEGLYDRLKEKQQRDGEVVVEKPSSALLIPDVTTGHVDAAVAYISDVLANRDRVDIVRIESPLNRAVQPFSIGRTSDHKHLMRRLFRRIASSPEAFEQAGFRFRLGGSAADDDEVSSPAATQASTSRHDGDS